MKNYLDNARGDAIDMALHFIDEIVEQLIDSGEASDDLFNHYSNGDSYHHENHVDKWYELKEAAEVLDQLSDEVETDSGLWQGLEPERAIGCMAAYTCCMAAYTYGNAVYSHWRYIIERINEMSEVTDLLDKITELEDDDESEESLDDLRNSLTNVVRSTIESN